MYRFVYQPTTETNKKNSRLSMDEICCLKCIFLFISNNIDQEKSKGHLHTTNFTARSVDIATNYEMTTLQVHQ